MFSILACVLAFHGAPNPVAVDGNQGLPPLEQPPRLRTLLKNGAVVFVEKVPNAATISVQLLASSRGTKDTPKTHGLRHLLEHLLVKGSKGDLSLTLERQGAILRANTLRDVMQFVVDVPSGKLQLGLDALSQVLRMPDVTTEALAREEEVIAQEGTLREPPALMSSAAWKFGFGAAGLDPFGDLDVIRHGTLEALKPIHRVQFAGSNLVIAIAGNVDVMEATKAASAIIGTSPPLGTAEVIRSEVNAGTAHFDGTGYARSAFVPSYRDPRTAAILAAGLAIASEAEGSFLTYTPSVLPGLITVGHVGEGAVLSKKFDQVDANDLFARGRALAKRWVYYQMTTPQGTAFFRGILLAEGVSLRPEALLENLDAMTLQDFKRGIAAFSSEKSVTVVGE